MLDSLSDCQQRQKFESDLSSFTSTSPSQHSAVDSESPLHLSNLNGTMDLYGERVTGQWWPTFYYYSEPPSIQQYDAEQCTSPAAQYFQYTWTGNEVPTESTGLVNIACTGSQDIFQPTSLDERCHAMKDVAECFPSPCTSHALESPTFTSDQLSEAFPTRNGCLLSTEQRLTQVPMHDFFITEQYPTPTSDDSNTPSTPPNDLRPRRRRQKKCKELPHVHQCSDCGQSFGRRGNLLDHVKKHSPTRKVVQCPRIGCGKTYGRGADLQRHIRSYHTNEKYECHICGKGFRRSDIRNRHVKDYCQKKQAEQWA